MTAKEDIAEAWKFEDSEMAILKDFICNKVM